MAENSSSTGVSGLSILGIAFVILKLCKVIDWSWWYITMPFWGGFAVVLLIWLIFVILNQILE